MNLYYSLFYISIFFLPLTYECFRYPSFLVFQIIVMFLFFSLLLKKKELTLTKTSLYIIVILLTLSFVGLIQASNYHNLLQPKTFIPFSLCPFFTTREVLYLFTYFMLFVVTTQLFDTIEKIKKLLYIIFVLSGIMVLIQIWFPHGEHFKFLLFGGYFRGSTGPFFNRNTEGAFFLFTFFTSIAVLIYNYLQNNNFKNIKNLLSIEKLKIFAELFFVITIFYYISASLSRGALLATIISLFVFLILFVLFYVKDKKKKTIILLIIAGISILIIFLVYNNFRAISFSSGRFSTYSEQGRLNSYYSVFEILKIYPLTGVGLCCSQMCAGYLHIGEFIPFLHNDWLEILLGVGYPLSILIYILIILILIKLVKNIKNIQNNEKILFIILCCALMSFCITTSLDFHFHTATIAFLFFIILAIVSSNVFDINNSYHIKITKLFIPIVLIFFSISAFLIYFNYKQSIVWKYSVYEKEHIKRVETIIKYTNHPEYFKRLVETYFYLTKQKNISEELKQEYRKQAHINAKKYLDMYPFCDKVIQILNETK